MRIARRSICATLFAIALLCSAAPSATAAPLNPNWCSDVPALPPPPHYEAANRRGVWTRRRNMCLNRAQHDSTCVYICQSARELWQREKARTLNQPLDAPTSTDQPQGPFQLEDGAHGYVLPLPRSKSTPAQNLPGPPSSAITPQDLALAPAGRRAWLVLYRRWS